MGITPSYPQTLSAIYRGPMSLHLGDEAQLVCLVMRVTPAQDAMVTPKYYMFFA